MSEEDDIEVTDGGRDLASALEDSGSRHQLNARAHALTDAQASGLAMDRRATVVVLAGTVKSGKTTLIASLYERFAHGPIAGRQFAGSLTLPGFEARAQGLRPVQGSRPGMPHTHRNAVPWLHLRVQPPTGPTQELLLGDFDGEAFDRVIEGQEAASSVPALRSADHVGVILDGHALTEPTLRPHARQRALDLIDVLTRPGAVIDPSAFALILTKLDLVNGASQDARAAAREVVSEARRRLAIRADFPAIPVIETAALSSTPDLPLGHGVEDLLDLWHLQPTTSPRPPALRPAPEQPGVWFGRFSA